MAPDPPWATFLAMVPTLLPLLALAPLAGPPSPITATQGASPRLVLESLDGKVVERRPDQGPVRSLAAAGAAFVRFEGVTAEVPGGAAIAPEDLATLELAGGDRLAAAVTGGDGDLLHLRLRGGVDLDLTIDVIRSIVFPGRIPAQVTTSPGPGEDGDRLYLVASGNLDRAEGFVDAFAAGGVTFEDERLGARTFAWDRVAALFITPLEEEGEDAASSDRGDGLGERVAVSLRGGGRLSGALRSIDGPVEGVRLALGPGAEVLLPGRVVTEVVLDDGSFRFLGDLAPTAQAATSLFGDELGFAWPMRVDRNVRGGPLVVGGLPYSRGLGVHAPSRVAWDLTDAGWRELRFACGVDDTGAKAGQAGAVVFRVRGDGKVLWESPLLRAGAPATAPPALDVTGVKRMELEVDPAGAFVLDRADWLRPMLVR